MYTSRAPARCSLLQPIKRVLLLNPPGDRLYARDKYCSSVSKTDYYWPQIDLLAQSAHLWPFFQLGVVDAIAEGLGAAACLERIRRGRYNAVVFLTCQASLEADMAFAARLHDELGLRTVAGGGVLLFHGERALERYPQLDAVMLDFLAPDCLRYLMGDLDRVEGFIFRHQGRIVARAAARAARFAYPSPRHELFPLDRYFFPLARRSPYTVILASLGCHHRCSFCVPGELGLRVRQTESVLEELRHVRSLGIRELLFQDSCFGAARQETLELLGAMALVRPPPGWACQTRVDAVDEELLAMMKRAGCHSVQFGVESGDEGLLQTVGKGITPDDARRAFALCRRLGLRTGGFFLLGLPGETEASARRTTELALELGCDVAVFSLAMPQPGTRMGKDAEARGQVEDPFEERDEVSQPRFSLGTLPPRRLWELRNQAIRRFYLRPGYAARVALRLPMLAGQPRLLHRTLRAMAGVVSEALAPWRTGADG